MSETDRRHRSMPPTVPHDHDRGMETYDRHEELPGAFLFPPEKLADSWRQPLNHPQWTSEYVHLRDDDPVLGLHLNGQARALPWWIMKNHHVANLVFDNLHVLVTLCVMCSSAAAFRAEVEERKLLFRVRGRYNGTILLDDMSTGTLWSPSTGVALAGAMRGTSLQRLPLSQCLWSEWLAMHPKSQVLHGDEKLREGHGSEFSPGSPGIGPGFRASFVRPLDERLPHNTLVLGVEIEAKARAYPLQTLARIGPVLNDVLGSVDLVVICRPGTLQALAFHRRVENRVLTFRASEKGEVYDEPTGSVWNEMGEAVSGPLAGTQLEYLNSGVEEWYAFAAYHPATQIFESI